MKDLATVCVAGCRKESRRTDKANFPSLTLTTSKEDFLILFRLIFMGRRLPRLEQWAKIRKKCKKCREITFHKKKSAKKCNLTIVCHASERLKSTFFEVFSNGAWP